MSEMVEIVARAMMSVVRETSDERLDPEQFRKFARAAIAAMREPTEGMQDAGVRAPEAIRPSCDHEVVVNPARIWRQMIDEALK